VVLAGTRIFVSDVLGQLAAGDDVEAVAAAYRLTPEQVRAALGYAAALVERKRARGVPGA
jgi:uncharacterized protein (DUF433 family)